MRIIAGTLKGRTLITPKSSKTRPTQGMLREAIFNICQNEVEGARFLDLFAGSGAMGLEALSRGASHATFVEQNRIAIQCIKDNISALQLESRSKLLSLPAIRALTILTKEGAQFDLIYVDPPYDLEIDLKPIAAVLAPNGILFVEERAQPKQSQSPEVPGLHLEKTKRFGIALVTLYRKKSS